MEDDSSIESLHPESIGQEDSLESVQWSSSRSGIDVTSPYPHPQPGEMDYLESKEDRSNSFDLENELVIIKDKLERYQTRFTNATMVISVLLWNGVSHNHNKPASPPEDDDIAYFKKCIQKFMTRIPEAASNGEDLTEANDSVWKKTEQIFNIFTNQLKDYVPIPTPTNDRHPDMLDDHAEFPIQDPKGEVCSSTVPKVVDEPLGQDVRTVPCETKDTNLQRSAADHESKAEQERDQKRIIFGTPPVGTKTKKGDLNTTIHMSGKNGRDILAMLNDCQVSVDEAGDDNSFIKQHLQSTVIYRPDAPNDVRQPNQKETMNTTTQTEEGEAIFSNESQSPSPERGSSSHEITANSLSNSSDERNLSAETTSNGLSNQTMEKKVTVQRTSHVEKDEIHVKLDSMSTLLEELKMMLGNATRMPRLLPVVPSENALYLPGMARTDFLTMLSDSQCNRDKAEDDNQFARKQKITGETVDDEVKVPQTEHVENEEEISVKLDLMHVEIEKVKMMLSNMAKLPTI